VICAKRADWAVAGATRDRVTLFFTEIPTMRLIPWLLTLPLLAACGDPANGEGAADTTPAALESAPPVRLVYATGYNYGCSSCAAVHGVVEVANLARDKDVAVVYSSNGGPWLEGPPAGYLRSPTSDRDLFFFEGLGGMDVQFAIRYRVHGQEFWDNAGGQNYRVQMAMSSQGAGLVATRSALGSGRDVVTTEAHDCDGPASVCITVLVRSRGPEQHVNIVSSVDGAPWTSTPASSVNETAAGDAGTWTARIDGLGAANTMTFAVSAEQAGATTWDNAYGPNYACNAARNHLMQGWVCGHGTIEDPRWVLPQTY
jgi:hypothetical protein